MPGFDINTYNLNGLQKKNKTSNFKVMEKNNNFLNKIKTHPIGPLKIRMNNDIELEKIKNSYWRNSNFNFKRLNEMDKLQRPVMNLPFDRMTGRIIVFPNIKRKLYFCILHEAANEEVKNLVTIFTCKFDQIWNVVVAKYKTKQLV